MEKGSAENPYSYEEFTSMYESGNWVTAFVDFGSKGIYLVVANSDYFYYERTGTGTGTGTHKCCCVTEIRPCTCLDKCPSCCPGTGTNILDDIDDDNTNHGGGDSLSNGEGTIPHGAGSPSRTLYHGSCNITGNVSVDGIAFDVTGQLTCSAILIYRNCYAFEDIYYNLSFSSNPLIENLSPGVKLTKTCQNFNLTGALKTSGRQMNTSPIQVNFEIQKTKTSSDNIIESTVVNESRNMRFPEIISITGANTSNKTVTMDNITITFSEV